MHLPTAQPLPSRPRSGRTQQGPLTPPPSPPVHLATQQQQQQQQRYHSLPQRASCSSYDDSRHPHSSHSPPNRARHAGEQRRLSGHGLPGPRLPPLPAGDPTGAELELFERRRLATASGGSSRREPRNSGLSLEVRSASPVYSPNRASTYSFLEGPPPPPRRDSRRFSGSLETAAEENGRRPSLLPRSALRTDDCFGLDFSFLDDEPPPRPDYSTRRPSADVGPFGRSPMAFPSTRRTSIGSDRSVIARIRDSVELESPSELMGRR